MLVLAGGRGDIRGYNPKIPGDDDGVVGVEEMSLPGAAPRFVGGSTDCCSGGRTCSRARHDFSPTARTSGLTALS